MYVYTDRHSQIEDRCRYIHMCVSIKVVLKA